MNTNDQVDVQVESGDLAKQLSEARAEIERLRKHNETVLGEKKSVKSKYEGLETDYQSLLEFKKAAELRELEEKKQYATALEKIKGDYEQKIEAFKAQFTDSEKNLLTEKSKLESELNTYKLDLRVIDALGKAGAINPKQTLKLIKDNLKLDSETGEPIAEDGFRKYSVDEYVTKLKTEADYSYLFKSEAALKGSISRTTGNPSSGGLENNPFTKEHWNLTQQGLLYQNNPKLYERLKAEANG